eukprot:scaffold12967_cov120-Isochrysis_galbana.AAC.12
MGDGAVYLWREYGAVYLWRVGEQDETLQGGLHPLQQPQHARRRSSECLQRPARPACPRVERAHPRRGLGRRAPPRAPARAATRSQITQSAQVRCEAVLHLTVQPTAPTAPKKRERAYSRRIPGCGRRGGGGRLP